MSPNEESPVEGCLAVLFDLFSLLGLKGAVDQSSTVALWTKGAQECGSWIVFVKYKLAAFFSAWTNQVLPEQPKGLTADKPKHLVCGVAGRWLTRLLMKLDERSRLGVLASIKLSKKGMPRPARTDVEAKVVSTMNKLFVQAPPRRMSWGRIDSIEQKIEKDFNLAPALQKFTREDLIDELRRTVREVFGAARKYDMSDRLKPVFPSTSASSSSRKGWGGCVLDVRDAALGTQDMYPAVWSIYDRYRPPSLGHAGGYLTVVPEAINTSVGEQQSLLEEKLYGERIPNAVRLDGLGELERASALLWFRLLNLAGRTDFDVSPVGLSEALKVRVITKGNPYAQTCMKSVQRFMFDTLARHPCFRSLTVGGDLSPSFLSRQLGKLGADLKWLSGDYEAATDNLQSWVSETVMDEFCNVEGIVGTERDVLMRLLTHHCWYDDEGVKHEQRTGQLMGSIVSFPILCLANAALCRLVVEQDRSSHGRVGGRAQRLSLEKAQILINGDDLLMKVSPFGRWLWRVIGSEVMGLKESLGKTYYSENFVEINSRLYWYHEEESFSVDGRWVYPDRFHSTSLINMGLALGKVRSEEHSSSPTSVTTSRNPSWGQRCTTLKRELESAPKPIAQWNHVRRLVVRRNSSYFSKATTIPWYLPEKLGGLGIPGTPSARDLILGRAAALAGLHWTTSVQANWKVWQLALDRIRRVGVQPTEGAGREMRDRYDHALGMLVIDLLFDTNRQMSDLVGDDVAQAGHADLLKVRQWSDLYRGKYGFPSLRSVKRKLHLFDDGVMWVERSVDDRDRPLLPDTSVVVRDEISRYYDANVRDKGVIMIAGDPELYD